MTDSRRLTVLVGLLPDLLQHGIAEALAKSPLIDVLDFVADESAAERELARRGPDLLVLGDSIPPALIDRFAARYPQTNLLVVAHDPTPLYENLLFSKGVVCLAHDAPGPAVVAACVAARLSPRQLQVWHMTQQGLSQAQIALDLGVVVKTVEKHSGEIRRHFQNAGIEVTRPVRRR